jgi:hypothetical protein
VHAPAARLRFTPPPSVRQALPLTPPFLNPSLLQGQAAQVTFQPGYGYSVPPSMASRPFSCVAREGVAALLSWLLTALWQALAAVVLFLLQYPQVRAPTAAAVAVGTAAAGVAKRDSSSNCRSAVTSAR